MLLFCVLYVHRMAFYGDKRIRQDQRNVEDTRSLNRQSQVEQDYRNFSSEDHIDAAIVIRRNLNLKDQVAAKRISCFVFEVIFLNYNFFPYPTLILYQMYEVYSILNAIKTMPNTFY